MTPAPDPPPIPRRITEAGLGPLDVWDLDLDGPAVAALVTEVLDGAWDRIRVGTLTPAASLTTTIPSAPEIAVVGDVLVAEAGGWHLELHVSGPGRSHTEAVQLFRRLDDVDGRPWQWGLRLHDGTGAQQVAIILPDPWNTPDGEPRPDADHSQLDVWNHLRATWLGEPPDPFDTSGGPHG